MVHVVRQAATRHPERLAYRFLADGEAESASLTYGELDRQAQAVAATVARHCTPGDRVVLLFAPELSFVPAFLGVLYAGCVAVPVAPPITAAASTGSLMKIVRDAEPRLVLSNLPEAATLTADTPVVDVADVPAAGAVPWTPPELAPGDLAFLQYTSGSTGAPKGVMVTHGNLLANEEQIGRVFGGTADDVIVSWLPVYHDMGLIGGVLHPLWLGATAVLMPPSAFLRRPLSWLAAISRYRGTISPAPNFAYELCVRALRERPPADDLDLRSWRVACNGSEPVRGSTLHRFEAAFAAAGFTADAFAPCYGMAEATLIISGVPRVTGSAGERPSLTDPRGVVSCGPWITDELVVVRDGVVVPDGAEGEICVRGPNVAAGYWRNPKTTAATFAFRVGNQEYLRTGDLGYVRDGALHVTGRSKDVLVIRGRNHHPGDIEATVQAVDPRLALGSGAVFMVDDGVVLVQAVRPPHTDLAELADAVRSAVAGRHGLSLTDVVLVRPGGVPRTTSGKVRRTECRSRYLAGQLPVVTMDSPRRAGDEQTVIEPTGDGPIGEGPTGEGPIGGGPIGGERLRAIVAQVLECPAGSLRRTATLTAQGLDSLRAMRLQQELADTFAVEVPLEDLLAGTTLATLETALVSGTAPGAQTPGGPGGGATGGEPGAAARLPDSGMTRGQEALAFLSAFGDDGAADYTIARSVRLPADLDLAAFTAAVYRVVVRHEQLRSRFVRTGEAFARQEWPLDAHQWCAVRHLPSDGDLSKVVATLLDTPLDLAADPLFRADILVGPDGTAVLVLRASHLVLDLHAIARLAAEVVHVYRTGGDAGLPAPAPFVEVLRDEAAFLGTEGATAAAAAVAQRLQDAPEVRWPVPAPAAGPDTPRAAAVTVPLDEESTDRVLALAAELDTTPFMVLLGGYALFLAGLWGHDDVVVGVPFAARDGAARRRAVSYLVNTLPLRLPVPPRTDLATAVRAARAALLAGLAEARVPLSVAAAQLRRARTGSPALFHAMFDLLDDPSPETAGLGAAALDLPQAGLRVGDLLLAPYRAGTPRPLADLDVAFTRSGRHLMGRFAFRTAVLDLPTGELLANHFADFLRHVLRQPTEPAPFSPADPAQRSVLLPAAAPVAPVTLGDLFGGQADRTPDAVAVVHGERRWSYAELDAWAERVADRIGATAASSAANTPLVGLLFDNAVDFLAAMLGALRRGHGIVPLPPDFPDERLAFMAGDCGIGALATAKHLAEQAHRVAGAGCRVVPLPGWDDPDGGACPAPANGRPRPPSGSVGDVAYVVYTSGTTGRPKAVPITHAQVLPLLHWQVDGLGAGPGMRLAQTLALSFDFGLQELMTTVLFGGTLCVPHAAERFSPEAYGRFLRRDGVTTLFATPTFVRELAAHNADLSGITLLVLGGEMLTPATVRGVLPLLAPGCRVINGYGPTEASINCTMHTIDLDRDRQLPSVPVGVATGASRVYVLDARGRVVPRGLVGEVCIGGPGVADGYLNRPEETAARFVPDTVTGTGRMYRTGDLGRVVDGELQLLGRMDQQVKIRGYRIELGEIAAVLRAAPGVEDAVVLLDREHTPPVLAAFVTGDHDAVSALRADLARRLPAYMLPGRITHVASLPWTVHGKLDEARLLAMSRHRREAAGPVSDAQATIAAIWCDVLDLDEVHPDDNFFELGGHSLAVGAVVSRVGEAFGLDALPLHTVFEHPTVRLLAHHVQELLTPVGAKQSRESRPSPLATPRRVRGRQRGLADRPSTASPRRSGE